MKDTFIRESHFISYDERAELHTTVDKEEGQYLGHPTAATLRDGRTVYTVYPKGHSVGQIVMKKSTDAGKTWSERLDVPLSFSSGLEIPTIYRLEDAEGRSRLILFSGKYPFRMSVSEDDGAHFSELRPIGNFGGYSITSVIPLAPGRYMAFFCDSGAYIKGGVASKTLTYYTGDGPARLAKSYTYKSTDGGKTYPGIEERKEQETDSEGRVWTLCYESFCENELVEPDSSIYSIETTDGGLTWSSPRKICTHAPFEFNEPCAIISPDGGTIAVLIRTDNSYPDDNPLIPKTWTLHNKRMYKSYVITSTDGGETWSAPLELCDSLCGDRHAATLLPDGRVFVTLRDKRLGSDLENNWVGWVGSFEDMISGKPGDCRILIKRHFFTDTEFIPYDCAYPFIEKMYDGSLLLGSYGCWEKPEHHFILSTRLSAEDIAAIPHK